MVIRKFYPRHDGGKESVGARPHILREHDVALEGVKIGDWETRKRKKKKERRNLFVCIQYRYVCIT